jgi:hypothetical protein
MIQFSLINYLSGKTLGYGCHRTFDRSLIDEAERRTWFFGDTTRLAAVMH